MPSLWGVLSAFLGSVCSLCCRGTSHSGEAPIILDLKLASSSGSSMSFLMSLTSALISSASPSSVCCPDSRMITSAMSCGIRDSNVSSSSCGVYGELRSWRTSWSIVDFMRFFRSCGSMYGFSLEECMGMDFPSPNSLFTLQVSALCRSAITYPAAHLACNLVASPPRAGAIARNTLTLSPVSNWIPSRDWWAWCCLYSISSLCCWSPWSITVL